MSIYENLEKRGLIAQCTDPALGELLAKEPFTMYVGFDPTSSSLHLGNLVPIMAMAHFQRAGHKVLALVGGATAMVGDPSGRSDERNLLTIEQVKQNAQGVRDQLSHFLDFDGPNAAVMVDNYDWTSRMSFIDWLREVGKYFTVNYMVAKESVKSRMQSEQGISYTEFSYMTMQAYDFLHLHDAYGCRLQGGGSDQWGNITAGTDLIRRLRQKQAYGLTFPLITTASGAKFGKSAGNAIWLDATRTSPWDFYQYLVRQEDRDVVRFLKIYTFLPEARIAELEQELATHPEQRAAQKALAYEVTAIVHGAEAASEMQEQAQSLYGSQKNSGISRLVNAELPGARLDDGLDIVELMLLAGMVKSKGEARRLLDGGGVYVSESRVAAGAKITREHVSGESLIELRSGKKNYFLVQVI
ncbi:MAG TPA: tyrosine--tRNA ligase [Candidatus Sulfopaludibacter sp.]|jgi:tyrosyl-tRNA synthetase|nr:tyrosine--tRNA ligase [Candidatus Sulfopaludibacter sp.]